MSGALLERLGRAHEALTDFTRAIQLGSGALSHNARYAALPRQQRRAFQPFHDMGVIVASNTPQGPAAGAPRQARRCSGRL